MMNHTPTSLFDLVRTDLEQERFSALHWEGSFADYLEILEDTPAVARNAWQRMIDMVESHGVEENEHGQKRWKIFDDPFTDGRDAVYGLDSSLSRLVQTLRAGSRGLGPERRVLLLHGPVGSSKSTTLGWWSTPEAMLSRRFMPPEKVSTRCPMRSARPVHSRAHSTRSFRSAASTPLRLPQAARFSLAVSSGKSATSWGTKPS